MRAVACSDAMQTHSEPTQDGAKSTKRKTKGLSRCRWVTKCQLSRLQFESLPALGVVIQGHALCALSGV